MGVTLDHVTAKIGDRTVCRLGFGAMRITGEGIWGHQLTTIMQFEY